MNELKEKKIQSLLVGIMSDGFNRSLIALEECGAVDTKKLRKKYTGIGSPYYDIVTRELEYTAQQSTAVILGLFEELSD